MNSKTKKNQVIWKTLEIKIAPRQLRDRRRNLKRQKPRGRPRGATRLENKSAATLLVTKFGQRDNVDVDVVDSAAAVSEDVEPSGGHGNGLAFGVGLYYSK
jgi:hypothetical protein